MGSVIGAPSSVAQAPVPVSALRGQNATPRTASPGPQAEAAIALARLHHAARREVQLGELGALAGGAPGVRRYGDDLAARFRAFDRRVRTLAAERGVDEDALTALFAGENLDARRRESDDLGRLGASHGSTFDRAFWLAIAQAQSEAADMVASMRGAPGAAADAGLRDLATGLAPELDAASREAVAVARGEGSAPAGAERASITR